MTRIPFEQKRGQICFIVVNISIPFSPFLTELADQHIKSTTKDQLAETARLLALNLAHYQLKFGEIPLENFQQLMETQEIDSRTARLVATGMENLVGVLGLVTTQDEAAKNPTH